MQDVLGAQACKTPVPSPQHLPLSMGSICIMPCRPHIFYCRCELHCSGTASSSWEEVAVGSEGKLKLIRGVGGVPCFRQSSSADMPVAACAGMLRRVPCMDSMERQAAPRPGHLRLIVLLVSSKVA